MGLADVLRKRGVTLGKHGAAAAAPKVQENNPPAEPSIEVLPEYRKAKTLINEGIPIIFVTGGAGTGKSTFIRWLVSEFDGRVLLTAPTGLAAINIGGVTLHRLCKLPNSWILPTDIKKVPQSPATVAKVLVIDEISMVNANVLDSVDSFLRLNRNSSKPFGGITVVAVGDMFQLPPVVEDSVRSLFEEQYFSSKFFAAHAVSNEVYAPIELTRVFRQSDSKFVNILSRIREGRELRAAINELNAACLITTEPPEGAVWLCPRNSEAEAINANRLSSIDNKTWTFVGELEGKFSEKSLPVPHRITLKVGAQVMLRFNFGHYVNGDIATVIHLDDDYVVVQMKRDGREAQIDRVTWEQYEYVKNPVTGRIDRKTIGRYSQLPLTLAWAMTIHKSQGMTLDRVHLDLGRGSFADGQTYVALSRCRALNTLSMSRPLQIDDIHTDLEATRFYAQIRSISAETI